MPKLTLRSIGSWLLMTAMLALFLAATWHLATGVMTTRIESVMAGGSMMFGAVTLAWLRLWLANALTREVAEPARPRGLEILSLLCLPFHHAGQRGRP